jgi:hypothetical protein
MGEGRSFLGDAAVDTRLVGVPVAEKESFGRLAGDRHALVFFSPRMRRPSLTGLKGNCVDCMIEALRREKHGFKELRGVGGERK